MVCVDLLTVGLSWLLVGVYVWWVRSDAAAGAPLLLGGVFMVYQYAQQAGGVIGAMAANLQNFSRFKTDYAAAEPIWNAVAPSFEGPPMKEDWQVVRTRDLEFTHVRADGSRAGIRDIGITLARGDRIALIGPSGGGKNTLLRVLAGLYDPPRGGYYVDGEAAEGVRSLASVSTLVPQETEIFEATLREHLTFGVPYFDEEIERIHRLSALVYFDRVIVMAEGRVVDAGTVAEILERQPAFREVVYSAAHGAVPSTAPPTVH